jgi:hypothetical protein
VPCQHISGSLARSISSAVERASSSSSSSSNPTRDASASSDAVVVARWVAETLDAVREESLRHPGEMDEDERMARSSITLVPIRPRRRGERRSLRTFAVVSLRPHLAFNPRPRRLSTSTDAFQLHPDVRSYGTTQRRAATWASSSLEVRRETTTTTTTTGVLRTR